MAVFQSADSLTPMRRVAPGVARGICANGLRCRACQVAGRQLSVPAVNYRVLAATMAHIASEPGVQLDSYCAFGSTSLTLTVSDESGAMFTACV